jgi:hypothetical protein
MQLKHPIEDGSNVLKPSQYRAELCFQTLVITMQTA